MSASHVGGPRSERARTLVLGWGNDLRSDDAAGRRVAEAIGALRLASVEVLAVHQLVPEHAAALAGRHLVVFVDADVDVATVVTRRLRPAAGSHRTTHQTSPQALLGLAAALGGAPARADLVAVPARFLGMGTALSPHTEAAVAVAVDRVLEIVRPSPRVPP